MGSYRWYTENQQDNSGKNDTLISWSKLDYILSKILKQLDKINQMATEFLTTTPDCEIVSSRIIKSQRELVYRAWSDANHLKNWWGPAGFTNTFTEFDFRVGGKWSFIMHGPEKGNYANECEFIKIEKPCIIAWKRYSKPIFQVVATFEEVSEEDTKIVFKMLFASTVECRKIKPFVVDKNEENFDRLENELAKMIL